MNWYLNILKVLCFFRNIPTAIILVVGGHIVFVFFFLPFFADFKSEKTELEKKCTKSEEFSCFKNSTYKLNSKVEIMISFLDIINLLHVFQ